MESVILKPDNVQTIISTAPEAYTSNLGSHDRCLAAGEQLLNLIQQGGMTDELDVQAADFIRKAKTTVKAMLERRSPSTKLMDEIRSVFTQLENDIDPANKKSLSYKLQLLRNEYAAKKYEQAEAARRAAAEKAAAKLAADKYRSDVLEDYMCQFNAKLEGDVNKIIELAGQVTLDSYDADHEKILKWPCTLPADWFLSLGTSILHPAGVKESDLMAIRGEVVGSIMRRCQDQYQFEMEGTRDKFLDGLPSKKIELERALANPDELAEIEAQIASAYQRDVESLTSSRAANQVLQSTTACLESSHVADDLFAAIQDASPSINANVKKSISLTGTRGILKVIALWWEYAGKDLTAAELEKMFKKQLTLCDKLANQPNPVLLDDPDIEYKDVVVAK